MSFTIGSQHAGGQINNVQGDQHIAGGQHAVVITDAAARRAVHDLRGVVAGTALGRRGAAAARAELDEIDAGVGARPDRPRAARALERLTRLLTSAGALATAGAALLVPLRALAGWLGALGVPLLAMLG